MPKLVHKKTYRRTIAAAEGEVVRMMRVWMRDVDIRYLQERYGNMSKGVRDLVTADRRAFENEQFDKR